MGDFGWELGHLPLQLLPGRNSQPTRLGYSRSFTRLVVSFRNECSDYVVESCGSESALPRLCCVPNNSPWGYHSYIVLHSARCCVPATRAKQIVKHVRGVFPPVCAPASNCVWIRLTAAIVCLNHSVSNCEFSPSLPIPSLAFRTLSSNEISTLPENIFSSTPDLQFL